MCFRADWRKRCCLDNNSLGVAFSYLFPLIMLRLDCECFLMVASKYAYIKFVVVNQLQMEKYTNASNLYHSLIKMVNKFCIVFPFSILHLNSPFCISCPVDIHKVGFP